MYLYGYVIVYVCEINLQKRLRVVYYISPALSLIDNYFNQRYFDLRMLIERKIKHRNPISGLILFGKGLREDEGIETSKHRIISNM